MGALQTVGGLVEMAAGASLAAAGIGGTLFTGGTSIAATIAGGMVVLHGLDVTVSGLCELYDGQSHDTFTSVGLQMLGCSQTCANIIDAGISIVGSLGAGIGSAAAKTAQIVKSADAAGMGATEALSAWENGSKALSNPAWEALGGESTSAIAKNAQINRAIAAVKAGTATAEQIQIASSASKLNIIKSIMLSPTGLTPLADLGAGAGGAASGAARTGRILLGEN